MTDQPEEVNATEFFAEIALGLIERDLLTDRAWRPAYTLGAVLDYCVSVTETYDGTPQELASEIVLEIAQTLAYAQVLETPTEEDIDTQASMFREMLDRADELGKNDSKEDET